MTSATATTQTRPAPTTLVTPVLVEAIERISPSFVRVTFGGPGLVDLSTADGFDTRFKVVFPGPTGLLPGSTSTPEQWQESWRAMPEAERSPMRTYTIREITTGGDAVRLVTDFVVHEAATGDESALGPACRWALTARPGDLVHIVGPHRRSPMYGGTEFDPGALRDLLLIGDETALPAIARILEDVGPGFTGHAFVEVPTAADIPVLPEHDLVDVTWLVRGGARQGRTLVAAVRSHLGLPPTDLDAPLPDVPSTLDVEVWETARYSSAGEDLGVPVPDAGSSPVRERPDLQDTYAWIAGESWCVRALRRVLVTELGVERSRVAFMGYWREGVAMRS
ncbi:siderophore-interacting protein [Pedococcus soli]